jgi:hypothetical protein
MDIVLNFDEIFNSEIKQLKGESFIKIVLDNVVAKSNIEESIESDIVSNINIISYPDRVEIVLTTLESVNLLASKTVDGYGIRLRIKSNKANISNIKDSVAEKTESGNKMGDYSKYYIVIAVLMLLVIVLLVARNYFQKMKYSAKGIKSKGDIEFLYQKLLDEKNRFVVMKFDEIEYTLIVGQTNLLLNKKTSLSIDDEVSIPKSKKAEFENILKESGIDLENANIIVKN